VIFYFQWNRLIEIKYSDELTFDLEVFVLVYTLLYKPLLHCILGLYTHTHTHTHTHFLCVSNHMNHSFSSE